MKVVVRSLRMAVSVNMTLHVAAATLPHWLPYRLPRKDFLVAADRFLVAAGPYWLLRTPG